MQSALGNGAFTSVTYAGQGAPCWTTRAGKYVFTANAASKTISRLIGTGNHLFVDSSVAASITAGGGPSDIDADEGVLGVIDHAAGQSDWRCSPTTSSVNSRQAAPR